MYYAFLGISLWKFKILKRAKLNPIGFSVQCGLWHECKKCVGWYNKYFVVHYKKIQKERSIEKVLQINSCVNIL